MREDADAGHALDRRPDAGADGRRPHPRGPPQRCRADHAGSSRGRRRRRCSSGCASAGATRRPDELGLSHYLEHMLFKGTPTRPPGSIDTLIEGFGGSSNAFTSYDFTHYDVLVPAAHVRPAMELLADIAVNASFVPAELEAEKKVVFEEMNLLQDDPEKFLTRRLSELAYVGHPYGRPILGTPRARAGPHARSAERVLQEALRPAEHGAGRRGPGAGPRRSRAAGRRHRSAGWPAAPAPPRPSPADPVAGRRASRRRPAPGAAGRPRPGVAGAGRSRGGRGHHRRRSADLHPGRWRQLAAEPDGARGASGSCSRSRPATSPASSRGIVAITARLDAKNLEAARGGDPRRHPARAAEGVTEPERQRALITAEASYAFDIETAEGLAKILRPGRDDVDARRRAAVPDAPAPGHRRADPGRRPQVPRRRRLRARAPACRRARSESGSAPRSLGGAAGDAGRVRAGAGPGPGGDRALRAARQRPHGPRAREPGGAGRRGGAAGPDGLALGDAGERGHLELHPRGDGEGDHQAERQRPRRDGGRRWAARSAPPGDVDYSGIQGTALARYWRELLEITAELALSPRLAPEDVPREREWLLSRIQRRRDNAPSRAFDELYAALYGSHPYGAAEPRHARVARSHRPRGDRGLVPRVLPTRAHDAGGQRSGVGVGGDRRGPAALRRACRQATPAPDPPDPAAARGRPAAR